MQFINNFLRKIRILLRAKFIFKAPKKSELIFFDYNLNNHFKFFYKKKFEIIHIRMEKINFIILLNTIAKTGLKSFSINYIINYINYVSPKIILTFSDISPAFYLIKNYTNGRIKTISIQLSFRHNYDFKQFKLKKSFYNVDYLFTHSNYFNKYYSKNLIANKTIEIGSFLNNFYKKKIKNKQKKGIIFISQFKESSNDMKYFNHEKKILEYLIKYSKEKKINFIINIRLQKNLYDNHSDNLKASKKIYLKNFKFIDQKNIVISSSEVSTFNIKGISTYDYIDCYENILIIDTSMGPEALARGAKVIAFPLKKNFGSKKDFFISRKLDYKSFKNQLNLIIFMKKKSFFNKIRGSKLMINFDQNNKILKKLILNQL